MKMRRTEIISKNITLFQILCTGLLELIHLRWGRIIELSYSDMARYANDKLLTVFLEST